VKPTLSRCLAALACGSASSLCMSSVHAAVEITASSRFGTLVYHPETLHADPFIRMTPLAPDVTLRFAINTAYATFSGGLSEFTVTSADFDQESGVLPYGIDLAATSGHICHTITVFEPGAEPYVIWLNPDPYPTVAYDKTYRYPDCSKGGASESAGCKSPGGYFPQPGIPGRPARLRKMQNSPLAALMPASMVLGGSQIDPEPSQQPVNPDDLVEHVFADFWSLTLQPEPFPSDFSNVTGPISRRWDRFAFSGNDPVAGEMRVTNNPHLTSRATLTPLQSGNFFPAVHENELYLLLRLPELAIAAFNKDPMYSQTVLTQFPPHNAVYEFSNSDLVPFYDVNNPDAPPLFYFKPSAFYDAGRFGLDVNLQGASIVPGGGVHGSNRLFWTASISDLEARGGGVAIRWNEQSNWLSGVVASVVDQGASIELNGTGQLSGHIDYFPGYGNQFLKLNVTTEDGSGSHSVLHYDETSFAAASLRRGSGVDGIDNDLDGQTDEPDERFDKDLDREPSVVEGGNDPDDEDNSVKGRSTGGGLASDIFHGTDLQGPPIQGPLGNIDHDWGGGAPHPDAPADQFSIRWSGRLEVDHSDVYTFHLTSDDGVRLRVNGDLVIDNWTDHAPTENSATVHLQTGRLHEVTLEFYENGGGAVARLEWESSNVPRQVVPTSRLYAK